MTAPMAAQRAPTAIYILPLPRSMMWISPGSAEGISAVNMTTRLRSRIGVRWEVFVRVMSLQKLPVAVR